MRNRRHPAEVTAERLGVAVETWHDEFTGQERDSIGVLIFALDQIAERARSKAEDGRR